MKIRILLFVPILLLSCDKDAEESKTNFPLPTFEVVEGKYKGTWTWDFGTGDISMVIRNSSVANRYSVDFYETANFRPMFNSDGETPEARGFLFIENETATIELSLGTDSPPCSGSYDGEGIRTDEGVLKLAMEIVHDCAEDAPATWRLTKIEDF